MSEKDKDWLDEEFPEPEAEEAPATDKAEEAQASAEPEPTKDAEPEAAAADAPVADDVPSTPDAEDKPSQQNAIPLAVHLAEREKRQNAERAKEEAERKYAEMENRLSQQQQQRDQKPVDPIDDPEGFQAQLSQQAQMRDAEMRLQFSEELMRDKVGDETFDKMATWWRAQAQTNPALVQHGLQQRSPWRYAYEQYQRDQTLSSVGSDIEAYKEKIRAEALAEFKAEHEAQLSKPAATPDTPPSLAKGGSGGSGERTLTDKEVFDDVFPH